MQKELEDKDIELHIDRETLLQEYIPKDQYEARLKVDMVAILTEIQLEILELKSYESSDGQDLVMLADIGTLFQQKINALRGEKQMQEKLKKLRDICRSYHSCYDECPLFVDKRDCVMAEPPSNWSDEDIEKIALLVEGDDKDA